MPDISMCRDATCPSAAACFRFRAIPDRRQSWGSFDRGGGDRCRYFISAAAMEEIRPPPPAKPTP